MSRFLVGVESELQSMVRRFAQKEIRPRRLEAYEGSKFYREMWQRCGELGLLGLMIPENFGGSGLTNTAACVLMEELGRESPGLAVSVLVPQTLAPLFTANAYLAEHYLPGMISGDLVMATGWSDPAGIVNYADHPEIAVLDGDDFVLNGTRQWVTNGTYYDVLLLAGLYQGSLWGFVVEKDHPGISVNPVHKMGLGSPWGLVTMNDSRVSRRASIDLSFLVKDRAMDVHGTGGVVSMLYISAIALGAADRVFEMTVDYLCQRNHAGKPIAAMQAIQHKLAKSKAKIEAGRAMLYTATRLQDEDRADQVLCHLTKPYVTEMAVDVIQDCMTLHGGTGYAFETGIEGYLRDVLGTLIGENTAEMLYSTAACFMGLPDAKPGAL